MFSTMPDRLVTLILLNCVHDLLIVIKNLIGSSREWCHSTRLDLNYNLRCFIRV
jgi:hypothetical protein